MANENNIPMFELSELVMVPKYDYRCNVCKWSKNNVELYNWTCRLILQGVSSGRVQVLLVQYMKDKYPEEHIPSKKSVWGHFKKHVMPKEEVDIMAAKIAASRKAAKQQIEIVKRQAEIAEQQAERIADIREKIPGVHDPLVNSNALKKVLEGNFDEYEELCALYTKFREVHDKIYETAGSLLSVQSTGMNDWSQNKIQTYVSMVNTQKSVLAEIGKMRQGDKLVSVVAKYIIEMFTKSIVGKLTEEFATLAGIMRRQGVPDDVMEAFQAVTHDRLAHLIVEEAKTAMVQTKKEFKLPN